MLLLFLLLLSIVLKSTDEKSRHTRFNNNLTSDWWAKSFYQCTRNTTNGHVGWFTLNASKEHAYTEKKQHNPYTLWNKWQIECEISAKLLCDTHNQYIFLGLDSITRHDRLMLCVCVLWTNRDDYVHRNHKLNVQSEICCRHKILTT